MLAAWWSTPPATSTYAALAGAAFEIRCRGSESNIQHCLNTAWSGPAWTSRAGSRSSNGTRRAHRELMERARSGARLRRAAVRRLARRRGGVHGAPPARLQRPGRRRPDAGGDPVPAPDGRPPRVLPRHAPGFERRLDDAVGAAGRRPAHRRVAGRRKLIAEDWKQGVRHADEIGVSPSPSQKFASVSVPYGRSCRPSWTAYSSAGRHIACDAQTQAFMREIPQCWLTGQAAGVAAALASAGDARRRRSTSAASSTSAPPGRVPASRPAAWSRAAQRPRGLGFLGTVDGGADAKVARPVAGWPAGPEPARSILRELIRERNVTRAAERVAVSQPAASAALARLRRHFGDNLLGAPWRGLPAVTARRPAGRARGAGLCRRRARVRRRERVRPRDVDPGVHPADGRLHDRGDRRAAIGSWSSAGAQRPPARPSRARVAGLGGRGDDPADRRDRVPAADLADAPHIRSTELFRDRWVCVCWQGNRTLGRSAPDSPTSSASLGGAVHPGPRPISAAPRSRHSSRCSASSPGSPCARDLPGGPRLRRRHRPRSR